MDILAGHFSVLSSQIFISTAVYRVVPTIVITLKHVQLDTENPDLTWGISLLAPGLMPAGITAVVLLITGLYSCWPRNTG